MRRFTGRAWLLGDDIDTDIILPTEYLALRTIEEMKPHAFAPLRPELAGKIQGGDILVAGFNFGCGSSREQAPEVLKALGICCVIAKSYARIFFRNALNNGLLLIEHEELPELVQEGELLTVEVNREVCWRGRKFPIREIPEQLLEIVEAGGLVNAMKRKNAAAQRDETSEEEAWDRQ